MVGMALNTAIQEAGLWTDIQDAAAREALGVPSCPRPLLLSQRPRAPTSQLHTSSHTSAEPGEDTLHRSVNWGSGRPSWDSNPEGLVLALGLLLLWFVPFKKKETKLPLSGKKKIHLACQCRRQGFDPWPRKSPYFEKQLSLGATTAEPTCCNY